MAEKTASRTAKLVNEEGFPEFIISIFGDCEDAMSFEVHKVMSWEADESKTPCRKELYLSGVVKFDGCAHLTFGEAGRSWNMHLYGKDGFNKHCQVITTVYELAESTIKNFNKGGAGYSRTAEHTELFGSNLIELADRINEESRVKAERRRDQLIMRIGALKFKAQKMQANIHNGVGRMDSELCAVYNEIYELEGQL
jgi:hypothetical protein